MEIARSALALCLACSVAGCGYLVTRRDAAELPAPVASDAQARLLEAKIRAALEAQGYKQAGSCWGAKVAWCGSFEGPKGAQIVLSVPRSDPSRLDTDYVAPLSEAAGSFAAFSAVREAVK